MLALSVLLSTPSAAPSNTSSFEMLRRPIESTQFTSSEFTRLLHGHGIRISMDGKGCWRDNVFVERVWRSIKYEEVYLHAYETVSAAREGIGRYINFYNTRGRIRAIRLELRTWCTSHRCISLRPTQPNPAGST